MVAPEVITAGNWARKSHENHARMGLRPPLSELLWAYAGGAVAGNLIFWIPSFIVGLFLVIALLFPTGEAWFLLLYPGALAIGLAVHGSSTGKALAISRGEDPAQGAYLGGFVGFGIGILIIGSIVGIGTVVVLAFSGLEGEFLLSQDWQRPWEMWPLAAVAALGACIWILVRGVGARRGPRLMPPRGP